MAVRRAAHLVAVAFAFLLSLVTLARRVDGAVDDAHEASGKAGPRFGTSTPSFFNGGENLLAWDENALDDAVKIKGEAGMTHLQRMRRTEAERQLYLHAGASSLPSLLPAPAFARRDDDTAVLTPFRTPPCPG